MVLLGGRSPGQKKYPEAEPLMISGLEGLKARDPRSRAQPRLPCRRGPPADLALHRLGQAREGGRVAKAMGTT